ncbi:MAG: ABC transporter permease [Candidatus Aramenus sulfurataquae]|jgi:ABC-2 type transport system permease protein|uniref:ABC transporter permease n=2 Tax=Candidatus Aramenus sulfurataquae TaxID=1326980 RepID=A0AAE3FK24_9CREN|nr:ABC transporter permease [Candidatus Aramenus sulfurataquae]
MSALSKLYAFLYLRGFKVWLSYRTQVILTVLSWTLPVFTYYFVGTSLGNSFVEDIGVKDYTSFFVVGLAFQGYVSSVITTVSQRIRNEQLYGTIEYYVLSRSGVTSFLFYSSLWGFTVNTVNAVIILLVGLGLGVRYNVNVLPSLVIVAMLLLSTLGLAFLSGAFTMVIKQGNPISFFFSTFTTLTTGVVFPVTVLPPLVRDVSFALPLTWALDGLRLTMLNGYSLTQVAPILEVLALFDIVLVPLGIWAFKYAFKIARVKGTLGEY